MQLGGNNYKLVLLDTNAIREIVFNENQSGKGFFEKFINNKYAPCISIYNVIELMPYNDIYEKFLEFFNLVPCFLIYPFKLIIQEEYNNHIYRKEMKITNRIANAFTPIIDNESYNFKKFLKVLQNSNWKKTIENEILQLPQVANEWNSRREEVKKIYDTSDLGHILDNNFYLEFEKDSILKDLRIFGVEPDINIDIRNLLSIRIMEYSQYSRLYLTKKRIKANDVMDIRISSIVPYIDAVITESYQADIYKKAKKIIPQIKNLEIYKLHDIRINN